MRIDRLTITNFKGFAEQSFRFERSADAPPGTGSFHVLIGQNGRGKTSALDAIAVAVGGCYRARGLRLRDPLSRRLLDGAGVPTVSMDLIGSPVRSPLVAM